MTTVAATTHDSGAAPKLDDGPLSFTRAFAIWSRHLLALIFPLSALSFVSSGPHPGWITPLWILPIYFAVKADRKAGPERRQPHPDMPAWPFDLLLLVLVAIQIANVVLLARMFGEQSLLSVDTLMAMLVVGSSSGYSGIVVAHELIHRPQKGWQQLGRLLLATVLYEHFYTEHVRGHHVRVGTPEDPATARFGESFTKFYVRTVPAQFKSAWRLETKRLGDVDMKWYDPRVLRSRVVHGVVVEWGIAAAFWYVWGPAAFLIHLFQAVWASRALEVVNYFEHWGLTRTTKRVMPENSWDTHSWFTYYALTGLSRHADHHAFASRQYQQLRVWEEPPMLPRGYLAMFPLVLARNRQFQKLATQELERKKLGPFAPAAEEAA